MSSVIFSFSTNPHVDYELTEISDATRITIADDINFRADGGTCLGKALETGVEVHNISLTLKNSS